MTEAATPDAPHTRGQLASQTFAQIMDAYDLESVAPPVFLSSGMMNRNWRVETSSGCYALKEIVDVPLPKARLSLRILHALAAAGLPVCPPRLDAAQRSVVEIDGRSYCLLPWATGTHRPGTTFDTTDAATLGMLLARVHNSLARPGTGLEPAIERPRAKVTSPESAEAEANRFLHIIAALDQPEPFDTAAATALQRRLTLLAIHAGHQPADEISKGPVGWTHGDVQPLNLLWENGRITAILDWDRLAIRPYGEEVVRTGQVQFTTPDGKLDLELISAFIAGYREIVDIADDDLTDATERLWWKRMTDFWQLKWHYDKADHGPDELWVSGERLLHWWSSRRDRVRAAFTGRA